VPGRRGSPLSRPPGRWTGVERRQLRERKREREREGEEADGFTNARKMATRGSVDEDKQNFLRAQICAPCDSTHMHAHTHTHIHTICWINRIQSRRYAVSCDWSYRSHRGDREGHVNIVARHPIFLSMHLNHQRRREEMNNIFTPVLATVISLHSRRIVFRKETLLLSRR